MHDVGSRTERPIIFSGPVIQAILERRKTQTRRVMRDQPAEGFLPWNYDGAPTAIFTKGGKSYPDVKGCKHGDVTTHRCPFGVKGDRLWVRETIDLNRNPDNPQAVNPTYRADGARVKMGEGFYKFPKGPTCPSIFMPRWASRIKLEIEEVLVQQLHDITTGGRMFLSDVEKEGCPRELGSSYDGDPMGTDETDWFINLWNSINAKRGFGWDTNPWVFVVEFQRIKS